MFRLNHIFTSNKQVLFLASGLAIAQAIPLLFSPVLSRLFTPDDYAILAIMIAMLNIVYEITTLRYDRAIVIAKTELSAKNLLFACFGITLLIGFLIYPVTNYIYENYLIENDSESLELLSFFTPFILTFMGMTLATGFWFQRIKAHRIIVVNKIVQMSAITFISVALGYWGIKNGLVWGYFVGWTILFLFTLFQLYRTKVRPFLDYDKTVLRASLKDHSVFPKYNTLPGLFNAMAMSLPVFIIIDYYGTYEGGNFNMCRQLLLLPIGFISSSFSQVYYRRITEAKEEGKKIFPHLKQLLLPVLLISIPMVLVVSLFGPEIFSFVLGSEWELSGEYASVYIFAVVMQFFALCLSIVFPVLGLIKAESLFKGLYFILICALFVFKVNDSQTFVIYYSIIEIISFGSMLTYLLIKAKNN